MKLPISKRLLCCASMVQSGARVADIGTDHGYLGIYLLQTGAARHVIACDLRKDPLENARRNAKLFGVDGEMELRLSDGLEKILPDEVDTVVMAGMGGDLIQRILSQCPWRKREGLQFILQPQSAGNVLRRWLCEDGFEIQREEPVQDGHFYIPSWPSGRAHLRRSHLGRSTLRLRYLQAKVRWLEPILRVWKTPCRRRFVGLRTRKSSAPSGWRILVRRCSKFRK
ncbi:MAG: class I SAM-dependent methyltransferase [Oscillospiraceae bacterium]